MKRTGWKIQAYFVREEQRLAALFERSAMPKLLLQSDAAPEELAGVAHRLWMGV